MQALGNDFLTGVVDKLETIIIKKSSSLLSAAGVMFVSWQEEKWSPSHQNYCLFNTLYKPFFLGGGGVFTPAPLASGGMDPCTSTCISIIIPGGPPKTEQSIQSIFQDFALINSYLCSPCWIEHLFLIIISPRLSNLVENFFFTSNFLWTVIFGICPISRVPWHD